MSAKKPVVRKKKPSTTDEDAQGRTGVHLVGLKVSHELGWTFREKPTSDIGIDGEIEVKGQGQSSHGRVMAVQIKCGPSYLKNKTATGHLFRGDYTHLKYWTDFSVPVIIILCDPSTGQCWWEEVNLGIVQFHGKGWSIEVPYSKLLDKSSLAGLNQVAARFQKKDLIELTFRDWLGWSFSHQMRLASIMMMPRDYHWFSHLGAIGTDDFYMIDYLVAGFHGYDVNDVDEMLRHVAGNHREFSYGNFLLAFISESLHHLQKIPDPPVIKGVSIQYVPLLLSFDSGPQLREVGRESELVEYDDFYGLDDTAKISRLNRKRSGGC